MEGGYFFIIFAFTILNIRIILYLNPMPCPTIKEFRLHHYMYAILIVPLGIFLDNIFVYAVGVGLFIDELGYLLIGGKNHNDNYSGDSLLLLCVFVVLIYCFKNQFVFWR